MLLTHYDIISSIKQSNKTIVFEIRPSLYFLQQMINLRGGSGANAFHGRENGPSKKKQDQLYTNILLIIIIHAKIVDFAKFTDYKKKGILFGSLKTKNVY